MKIVLMFFELVGGVLVINLIGTVISVLKVRYFQKKNKE